MAPGFAFSAISPPFAIRSSFTPKLPPRVQGKPRILFSSTCTSKTVRMSLFSRPNEKSILVFGGGSTLGKEVVNQFIDADWRVYTLDFYDASVECGGVNGCALPTHSHVPISLALPAGAPARIQVDIARKCLSSACAEKFDVVLNATLGFAPAGLGDDDLFETSEYMYRTSVESSLVTAKLASSFMAEGGLLTLLGSVAALPVTNAPNMLGFGAAKASVHQMVRLLAGSVGKDLPADSAVVAIVPEVLDTPLHRSMNNGAVEENWTPCDVVASKLLQWAQNKEARPPNAALISVATRGSGAEHGDNVESEKSADDTEHMFRLIQDSSFVQRARL